VAPVVVYVRNIFYPLLRGVLRLTHGSSGSNSGCLQRLRNSEVSLRSKDGNGFQCSRFSVQSMVVYQMTRH
jgi:hypothetical protein